MLIILSAQWPEARIESAFGRVPLPFLPLGATSCLAVQRQMAPGDRCVLTIPQAFLEAAEARLALDTTDICLLPQPDGLSRAAMLADGSPRTDRSACSSATPSCRRRRPEAQTSSR